MYWYIPRHPIMYWYILGHHVMYWYVPRYYVMYWYILGHHVMYWYILGHHVMYWYVPRYYVIYWYTVGHPIGAGILSNIPNFKLGYSVPSHGMYWYILKHNHCIREVPRLRQPTPVNPIAPARLWKVFRLGFISSEPFLRGRAHAFPSSSPG